MRWRALTRQLRILSDVSSVTLRIGDRAMTCDKICMTLIMCFSAALIFGSNQASASEPGVVVRAPRSGDVQYTCSLNIPWDWPHRCPPIVSPEPALDTVIRPHATRCPAQTVKIPMADGKERTVTIVRCP